MFPNQNQNFANLLQGQSLRVVAAPAQKPMHVIGPSPRPVAQPTVSPQHVSKGVTLQPQRGVTALQNQKYQVPGPTYNNLAYLLNPNPWVPARSFTSPNGIGYNQAGHYQGTFNTPQLMATKLPTPSFPTLKKLSYQ